MIKHIVKDVNFLSMKSKPMTINNRQVITDLKDTFSANRQKAIGLAANMLGYKKCTIIVSLGIFPMVMLNPIIVDKKHEYLTKEGCLSLNGLRSTTRFKQITVAYEDENFKKQKQTFYDEIAQIIQHEVDHCNGIII